MIVCRATVVLAALTGSFCAIAMTCAATPAASDLESTTAPAAVAADVSTLIQSLSHPDPVERQNAERALIAMGSAARDAVREATHSEDPEIASRARGVLVQLPWALPTDSPIAKQLLSRYGTAVAERRRIASQLANHNEVSVLLRLLEEDPDTELRWDIVGQLEKLKNLELDRRMKSVTADASNAPLLFLAAQRTPRAERRRALELYRRVIALESVVSAPAMNEVFQSYDELIDEALDRRDYPAAAQLLRRQGAMAVGTNLARVSAARLMALHGYVGPLPGFARDVSTAGDLVGRPVFTDTVIALYDVLGLPSPPVLGVAAQVNAPATPEVRYWAGTFFLQHQMMGPAESELMACAARSDGTVDPDAERGAPTFYDYDYLAASAHELLSRVLGNRNDDVAAAEHLRRAVALRDGIKQRGANVGDIVDLRGRAMDEARSAELHWRELRAARSVGDRQKLREHLDALKDTTPANTDIVLDVVPLLKEAGQPEAARAMFDKTYAQLRATVDADPDEPEPMNNLAWLCARSGERLDEALQLATKAITLDPDNAAYMDTAAEANFRVGNIEEAIRLETKGLEGRPNDKFMGEQLERFKAAKKK